MSYGSIRFMAARRPAGPVPRLEPPRIFEFGFSLPADHHIQPWPVVPLRRFNRAWCGLAREPPFAATLTAGGIAWGIVRPGRATAVAAPRRAGGMGWRMPVVAGDRAHGRRSVCCWWRARCCASGHGLSVL